MKHLLRLEPLCAAGNLHRQPAYCFTSPTPLTSLAGYLVSVDAYMNLQLANTEEYIDGQSTGTLGEVLIR